MFFWLQYADVKTFKTYSCGASDRGGYHYEASDRNHYYSRGEKTHQKTENIFRDKNVPACMTAKDHFIGSPKQIY